MSRLIKIAELGVEFLTITPKIAHDLVRDEATDKMADYFNSVAS